MKARSVIIVALLLLAPCVALADAGTPLIWASYFHMLYGNVLLGLLEGLLLAKVFHLRSAPCIGLLILANYLSAWTGILLLDEFRASQEIDLYNTVRMTVVFAAFTYVCTLVLEWPFIALAFARSKRWFSRSIKASFLIQTVSYLLLFAGFWLVSNNSLYADYTIVPPEELSLPVGVSVYFIANDDGHVYRRTQKQTERVYELSAPNGSCLLFEESSVGTGTYDLVAQVYRGHGRDKSITLMPGILTHYRESVPLPQRYGGWGDAPRIGAATNSAWRFSWGHWSTVGVLGKNDETGEHLRIAFGNPMMIDWEILRAIHLPEDKLLFQFGRDQLCLLDIAKKEIGLWARGYGPVAIAQPEESTGNM